MKTIKQAINELSEEQLERYKLEPVVYPFIDGVKFAEEWIRIEDEIPENGVLVLFKFDNDDNLVSTGLHNGKIFCPDFRFGTSDKVTHWRPITHK